MSEEAREMNTDEFHVSEPLNMALPQICDRLVEDKLMKENVIDILDEVERHVERIRKEAVQLEEEKETIFTTLDTLKHSHVMEDLNEAEKEDVQRYADRILARCSTIEVSVTTVRDHIQEDSLHQVNKYIDNMIKELKQDPAATQLKCLAFMNSCSSYCENGIEDKNFERALLGCTADDQKRIKKRLQGLMNYIDKFNVIP
ncbi:hypothetical protein RUM44_011702 [Polyplax serrata]|uniref:BAG family molecular chaperone regulator 2 n=1 Tax=Polyplax serrata TaxID=468196 RepID=A0ABR1ASI8_POLSC